MKLAVIQLDNEGIQFNAHDILWKNRGDRLKWSFNLFHCKFLKESMKMSYKYFFFSFCTSEFRFIRVKKINL